MTRARETWFFLLLLLGAWALRAAAAWRYASEPVWDAHYYDYYARRIAEGFGYSDGGAAGAAPHPAAHYPVGYSAFLSPFYWMFGSTHGVAIAINVAIGTALVAVSYLLVRSYARPTLALLAALLVAVHPGLILYSTLVMSEQLAALLAMLSLWCVALGRQRSPTSERWRYAGFFVLGLATLVRPQALLLFPALLPWPSVATAFNWLRSALVGGAITMAAVLPWTARNCVQMDGCALVSTNGGWNLAIGSFPRATGRFETLRGSDGCTVVTGQVQQDRCWGQLGMSWIRTDTRRWLALIPEKLHQTFDHESFAVNYLKQGRPELWSDEAANKGRERLSQTHLMLMALASAGVVAAMLRSRLGRPIPAVLWGLLIYAAGVVFTHAVFFGEDRYHMVLVPTFCIFAAEALVLPYALWQAWRARRRSAVAA